MDAIGASNLKSLGSVGFSSVFFWGEVVCLFFKVASVCDLNVALLLRQYCQAHWDRLRSARECISLISRLD